MIYATVSDLVDRFGELELVQLTDFENIPPSVIDPARVEIKIGDACAFIDGYVGQVYRLPLAGCAKPVTVPDAQPEYVAPPVLVRIACDLARYYLHDDLAPENEVYRRFKAAVKELEAIATGGAQLACPWGGSPGALITADAQSGGNEVWSTFSPRQVTDDSLKGFA
jgi:phage gp36-like protein